jgi:NADH-quinone oxidoreductase subunit C
VIAPAPVYAPNDGVIDAARALCGAAILDAWDKVGEVTLVVARDALVTVMTALRDDGYQQLMEIAGVDYPERAERFEVVYHLLSVTKNHRIRVKVSTDEVQPVPSVTGLWPVAGWLEREVFDMYGVLFSGNSDLRRILTDYGFVGHPFRKDFPLTGFVEMRYSETEKRVVYEPVKLAQDFRSFDFLSPWEGAQYALPGDEKASLPEAKGAPTPLSADTIKKADAAATPAGNGVTKPKVTETVKDTGTGGPKGDEPESKPRRRVQPKAASDTAEGKQPLPPEPAPPASKKPRASRKPDGTAQ